MVYALVSAHPVPQRSPAHIDVVCELGPRTLDPGHCSLSTENAAGADLHGDTGDFRGEGGELSNHGVHGVFELEHLALNVDLDSLREVSGGDSFGDVRDRADLIGQIARHRVDVHRQVGPSPLHTGNGRLATEDAVRADFHRHAGDLGRERGELANHRVHGVLELQHLSLDIDFDGLREVARCHSLGDVRDRSNLVSEVSGHSLSESVSNAMDE
jgi:hypothetical protein